MATIFSITMADLWMMHRLRHEHRRRVTEILRSGLRFVNKDGQPLQMMPRLELDPALLEQSLYR